MASLGGEVFTETTLDILPRFTDDARELAELIAGSRIGEEPELSDGLRCQVERILWNVNPQACE